MKFSDLQHTGINLDQTIEEQLDNAWKYHEWRYRGGMRMRFDAPYEFRLAMTTAQTVEDYEN